MSVSQEDPCFDFDLDFLPSSSSLAVLSTCPDRTEKTKKSIRFVKHKIVATDSLVRKYLDKKDEAEQYERALQTSKEECKEICLDRKNIAEKCYTIEKDMIALRISNDELQVKCEMSESQNEAVKSHANQLQILVKENETTINSYKIENQLLTANVKDYEKNISSLQKENASLKKDICLMRDIISGKTKLTKHRKLILKKYEKSIVSDDNDSVLGDDSDTEDDNHALSPLINESQTVPIKCPTNRNIEDASKNDEGHESDCSNELASADTGRGSSLAFSDGEKCFNSPDYYMNHSPINALNEKEKKNYVDRATSPITTEQNCNNSQSEIYEENIQIVLSPINAEEGKDAEDPIQSEVQPNMTNNADVHIKDVQWIDGIKPMACNNSKIINNTSREISIISDTIVDSSKLIGINITPPSPKNFSHLSNSEKECLELNNSYNLNETNAGDSEVKMILDEMRFNRKLITPIPPTPSKSSTSATICDRKSKHADRIYKKYKKHIKDAKIMKAEIKKLHDQVQNQAAQLEQVKALVQRTVEDKNERQDIVNLNSTNTLTPLTEHNRIDTECMIAPISDEIMDVSIHNQDSLSSSSILEIVENESLRVEYHENIDIDTNMDETNVPIETTSQKDTYKDLEHHKEYDLVEKNKYSEEHDRMPGRRKKLSKLEKLRKNLAKKSKIKSNPNPLKKIRKSKHLISTKKTTMKSDVTAEIRNKNAYDKAVQIMLELKSQQKSAKTKEYDRNHGGRENDKSSSKEHVQNLFNKELVVAIVKCDENRDCQILTSPSPKKQIATRSRSKQIEETSTTERCLPQSEHILQSSYSEKAMESPNKNVNGEIQERSRKRQKRESTDSQDIQYKRILRSSNLSPSESIESSSVNANEKLKLNEDKLLSTRDALSRSVTNFSNMGIISNNIHTEQTKKVHGGTSDNLDQIIFCKMLDKYAKQTKKTFSKKVPDCVLAALSKTLQDGIIEISEAGPNEATSAMTKLAATIQKWQLKEFIAVLMRYLKDPQRKLELFNKIISPPAPAMTKSEQILINIISRLKEYWPFIDVINCVLHSIEYELFKLNRTPDFDTIESMAHLYAVLCRYFKMDSRLRVFMLDALYCMQFKAVPLIKQCLEAWMHVLPLAHMGIAKSPVVTCFVYLLHFYKCEDRYNRVQEIRTILNRKYFYAITEWNEPKIIDMFKTAILELGDDPVEMKMLRMALIVLCKRLGPKWSQDKIIKNLLLKMIEKDVPMRVKIFCISMLGPLLKPYPVDMKVHCEIVMNFLHDKLKQNSSPQIEEAIISSLIYMSKHNQTRVLQTLLTWRPATVSETLESLLRDFVIEKPIKAWRSILSKIQLD